MPVKREKTSWYTTNSMKDLFLTIKNHFKRKPVKDPLVTELIKLNNTFWKQNSAMCGDCGRIFRTSESLYNHAKKKNHFEQTVYIPL